MVTVNSNHDSNLQQNLDQGSFDLVKDIIRASPLVPRILSIFILVVDVDTASIIAK